MAHGIHLERTPLQGCILDIGGGGEGVIGRLYPGQVIAIDRLEEELREAPDGPVKLVMDARSLAFCDACIDHATAFFAFLFMPAADHAAVAQEVFRVLRPGGRFLVWDTAFERANPFLIDLDIDAAGQRIRTTYGICRDDRQDAAHFRHVLEHAGFVPEQFFENDGVFFMRWKKPETTGAI